MKRLLLLMFIVFSYNIFAISYSIFPTRIEVDVNQMSTQELQIINNSAEPLRLGVDLEADPHFGEKYNLNDNIKIFPRKLFIKPAGRQVVRFRIMPLKEDGEFKSYIMFNQLENPNLKYDNDENSQKIRANFQIYMSIGIPVYGKGENILAKGEVKNLNYKMKNDELMLDMNINSTGNTSLKLYYNIKNALGKSIYRDYLGHSKRTGLSNLKANVKIKKEDFGKKYILSIENEDGSKVFAI